ncbi:MAG TPA: T9SS type A sorting domain-containing protein, partial [Bacteroidia bacterium]|nr:T9SS type A sorting domain-containing protein [Bacteroidia bacterium]
FNMTFPPAGNVAADTLNSSTPGVSGINYTVQVNNATDVMWALMPVNGSDVTITGSAIRAIGLWFTEGDTVNVSGLVNNSTYASFAAPLNDRILQLNNCSVQTWSLYVFDTSSINITGCIVGEVGNMGTSFVTATGVLCDGSGGYYWATDTSFSIAVSSTVFTNVRSQGNAIFVFGYGSVNGGASAIANSVMIVTQSNLPQDPIPYEHAIAWLVNINPLAVSYVNSTVNVSGSAWIDQGPLGSFMDFGSYDLWYSTSLNPNNWIPISAGNTSEVRNNVLAQWNTAGLSPGGYNLRLNTFNNLGDSIDAVKQVTLLPSVVGLVENTDENVSVVYPNPSNGNVEISFSNANEGDVDLILTDINGKTLLSENQFLKAGKVSYKLSVSEFSEGVYFYTLKNNSSIQKGKIVVSK